MIIELENLNIADIYHCSETIEEVEYYKQAILARNFTKNPTKSWRGVLETLAEMKIEDLKKTRKW